MNTNDMTVEARDGKSHGLRAPTELGSADFLEQLDDMLALCEGAKPTSSGYSHEVMNILHKYAPGRTIDLNALFEAGLGDWKAAVDFVKDDKCVELGVIIHKLVTEVYGAKPKKDADFIDGEGGVGFYTRLMSRMKRALEKAFDEKYHWKAPRPLHYLMDVIGPKAAMRNVHYGHPGHWRYPAGHGVKFATVYDYVTDSYELTPEQENGVFSVCYVVSMARSGGGVHLPEDNCAAWSLVATCDIDKKYKENS